MPLATPSLERLSSDGAAFLDAVCAPERNTISVGQVMTRIEVVCLFAEIPLLQGWARLPCLCSTQTCKRVDLTGIVHVKTARLHDWADSIYVVMPDQHVGSSHRRVRLRCHENVCK